MAKGDLEFTAVLESADDQEVRSHRKCWMLKLSTGHLGFILATDGNEERLRGWCDRLGIKTPAEGTQVDKMEVMLRYLSGLKVPLRWNYALLDDRGQIRSAITLTEVSKWPS